MLVVAQSGPPKWATNSVQSDNGSMETLLLDYFVPSGPSFSNSSLKLWFSCQFSVKSENLWNFAGMGHGCDQGIHLGISRPWFLDFPSSFTYWYRFLDQSSDFLILGVGRVGVVEWSISGSRDLHFRIPRWIFATGAGFLFNLTSLKFKGVGHGCGHFPKLLGLGTLIFDFLVHFYILVHRQKGVPKKCWHYSVNIYFFG